MVCDGLGGQAAGDIASSIVIRAISGYASSNNSPSGFNIAEAARCAINALADYSARHPESAQMATTLALAHILENSAVLAWCGDSRIMHIRGGNILYQTEDHSLATELIHQGNLTEAGSRYFPDHRVLQRSLGPAGNTAETAVHKIIDVRDNDWLVLCSDGLLELLSPQEIADLLVQKPDLEQLAVHLYGTGLAHTNDNCSGHIIQLGT